jgi:hypothetical protein
MDSELILQVMLLVAGACVLVATGLVVATYYFLDQARKELHRLRHGPYVARDYDGRPIRERR